MALHSTDQRVQQDGLAMYFMHYDYLRIHQTLRVAPAMAGGVTKQLSSMQDVVAMIEGMRSAGQLIVAVPRFHFQARRRLLFFSASSCNKVRRWYYLSLSPEAFEIQLCSADGQTPACHCPVRLL
jgi:hypothetical protein